MQTSNQWENAYGRMQPGQACTPACPTGSEAECGSNWMVGGAVSHWPLVRAPVFHDGRPILVIGVKLFQTFALKLNFTGLSLKAFEVLFRVIGREWHGFRHVFFTAFIKPAPGDRVTQFFWRVGYNAISFANEFLPRDQRG